MNRLLQLVAVGALWLMGCSVNHKPAFDHLEYSESSLAPIDTQLSPNEITLSEGIVIKARVKAVDDEGDAMDGSLRLDSLAPYVIDVLRGPEGTWVFVGAGTGETQISVSIDGDRVGHTSARVLAQP
jgi:hypothetical protein